MEEESEYKIHVEFTVRDIFSLKLQARIAMLIACQSAHQQVTRETNQWA
jgi:hypothetical protein